MVTRWLDGVAGLDTNDGTSFAQAWKTMSKATTEITALADGQTITLNVVNSGAYTMDATPAPVSIDTHATSTINIRGTDSSGNLALTTVLAPATGGSNFVYIQNVLQTTVRGFAVDFSPSVLETVAGQDFVLMANSAGGPVFVEDCTFLGAVSPAVPGNVRRIMRDTSGRADMGEVRYCVMSNMRLSAITIVGTPQKKFDFHHVVILHESTVASAGTLLKTFSSSNDDIRVYNNTIFIKLVGGASPAGGVISDITFSGDAARYDLYNNVFWVDNDAGGSPTVSSFIVGSATGTATFSSGTRGNNIFYTGPNVPLSEVATVYSGTGPWVPPYSGDVNKYEQADTALFTAPGSAYSWAGSGNGYSLTVARDLRLVAETSSGLSGTLPGALPSLDVDIGVAVSSSDTGPNEGDSIVLSVSVTNTGVNNEPSLVLSAPIPAGLTYVNDVPSAGTYDDATGLWSVPVTTSTPVLLQITATVDTGTRGSKINFIGSVSSTAGADTNSGNDSSTVILSIGQPEGQPTLPEYLDVLPFFQPVFEVDFDPTLVLRMNGTTQDLAALLGSVPVRRLYSEQTSRRIVIPASTTIAVNHGGVERGRVLMIEASADVNVAVDDVIANVSWPVRMLAVDSNFTQLNIQNADVTNAVTVQLMIVD